jgi:hypothetical protein
MWSVPFSQTRWYNILKQRRNTSIKAYPYKEITTEMPQVQDATKCCLKEKGSDKTFQDVIKRGR